MAPLGRDLPSSPVCATATTDMESVVCARCGLGFEPKAKIVNSNGELYHSECFVCAQCFRPFPEGKDRYYRYYSILN